MRYRWREAEKNSWGRKRWINYRTKELNKEGEAITSPDLTLGPDCGDSCIEVIGKNMEKHETYLVVWLLMKKCLQKNQAIRLYFRELIHDWFLCLVVYCLATLCRKSSCLWFNFSLISRNQSVLPRLITILSALSIILGERSVVNLHSEVCSLIFLGAFLHQRSYNIDMLGFNVILTHPPLTSVLHSSQSGPKAWFSDTLTLLSVF